MQQEYGEGSAWFAAPEAVHGEDAVGAHPTPGAHGSDLLLLSGVELLDVRSPSPPGEHLPRRG